MMIPAERAGFHTYMPASLALIALSACLLAACTTTRLEYDIALTEITRQPGAERLARMTVADDGEQVYTDGRMRIAARTGTGRFHLALENLGDRTARLQWEEASYVGADRRAEAVVRANDSGGSTVIPAGARVEATAIPASLARGDEAADFFGVAQAEGLEGTSVQLILPFLVGENRHEYTLVFTVRHAEVTTERNYPSGHDTFWIDNPEEDDEADTY